MDLEAQPAAVAQQPDHAAALHEAGLVADGQHRLAGQRHQRQTGLGDEQQMAAARLLGPLDLAPLHARTLQRPALQRTQRLLQILALTVLAQLHHALALGRDGRRPLGEAREIGDEGRLHRRLVRAGLCAAQRRQHRDGQRGHEREQGSSHRGVRGAAVGAAMATRRAQKIISARRPTPGLLMTACE